MQIRFLKKSYLQKSNQMKSDKAIIKSSLAIIIKVKIKTIHLIMYKHINNYVFRNNNNLIL